MAEAALQRDRLHPLAWTMAITKDLTITEAQARALVAAHPQDWRPLQLLLFTLNEAGKPKEETEPVRLRMCQLAAKARFYCKGEGPETERARPVRSGSEPAPVPPTAPTAPAAPTAPTAPKQ